MQSAAPHDIEGDPGFHAEAWLAEHGSYIRGVARSQLSSRLKGQYRRAGARVDYFVEHLVQLFWTKAVTNDKDFRVKVAANRAFLAVSIRNAVSDWVKTYWRELTYTEIRLDTPTDEGDATDAVDRRAGSGGVTRTARALTHRPETRVASPEDEVLRELDRSDRSSTLAKLEETFQDAILPYLEQVARHNRRLAGRLHHGVMRPVLDTLLARPCLIWTLMAVRDPCAEAALEAERVAHELGVNVRTVQNRRSDWLRDLRRLFAAELSLLDRCVRQLYPELRSRV